MAIVSSAISWSSGNAQEIERDAVVGEEDEHSGEQGKPAHWKSEDGINRPPEQACGSNGDEGQQHGEDLRGGQLVEAQGVRSRLPGLKGKVVQHDGLDDGRQSGYRAERHRNP